MDIDLNMALFNKPDNFDFRQSWSARRTKYVTNDICRMLTVFRNKLPNINVYLFSIAMRLPSPEGKDLTIRLTSSNMKKWCDLRSWINFVDVYDKIGVM